MIATSVLAIHIGRIWRTRVATVTSPADLPAGLRVVADRLFWGAVVLGPFGILLVSSGPRVVRLGVAMLAVLLAGVAILVAVAAHGVDHRPGRLLPAWLVLLGWLTLAAAAGAFVTAQTAQTPANLDNLDSFNQAAADAVTRGAWAAAVVVACGVVHLVRRRRRAIRQLRQEMQRREQARVRWETEVVPWLRDQRSKQGGTGGTTPASRRGTNRPRQR